MNFSALWNFILTFFNLLADQQDNKVPGITPSPKSALREEFNGMIEKALTRVAALTEKVEALEVKLKSSENLILELKSKDKVQVAFSAAVGIGPWHFPPKPYNTDKPLIFKKVITNIGNAYKKDKGHFVAPYAGIYYFVFFVHTGGSSGTNLYLYKGEEERIVQAQNHPLSKEKALNGGNAAFLELKAGDYVYLRMEKDSHVWASETHTTFSGFLVERTEDKKADT